ncbi:hypothetical protein Acsp03_53590 [Actinomadura sp. NBRC 104412]|nr:hypothetical protein Acsp03_53590 [Actinomadura sp. NBRC 104412]
MPPTRCPRCYGTFADGYCVSCGAPSGGRDADAEMIGPYRLVDLLGTGPAGNMRLAVDPMGREVVVHLLEGLAERAGPQFGQAMTRLRNLHSPFVAQVLDVELNGPQPYIATRYSGVGITLRELLARNGPLKGESLLRLARELADGLAAMHDAGVTHGDVKPGNIVMVDGRPVLIDFATAWLSDEEPARQEAMVGTPGYLAPEALTEASKGPAADVFAWAATVAEAATGLPPFGSGNPIEVLHRVRDAEPDLDGVPEPLRALLARALAKDPSERPLAPQLVEAVASLSGQYAEYRVRVPATPGSVTAALDVSGRSSFVAPLFVIATMLTLAFLLTVGGPAPPWLIVAGVVAFLAALALWRPAYVVGWAQTARLAHARRALARGRYERAEATLRRLAAAADRPSRRSVIIHASLAAALRRQGSLTKASAAYQRALELARGTPDADAALVSRLEANDASVRHGIGAPGTMSVALLDQAYEKVGTDPEAATVRSNLAVALRDEGRLREAEREARAALGQGVEAGSPDLPVLQANLAAILREGGDALAAEPLLVEAESAARRMLGRRHPDTLSIRASLAAVRHDLGRHAEAAALLEQVIADRARTLGRTHPSTLEARTSLGFVRLAAGDDEAAEREFQAVFLAGIEAHASWYDFWRRAEQGQALIDERRLGRDA